MLQGIEAFYSRCKGAKRLRVKGMDEFIDVEAEPSNGGNSVDDDVDGDDDASAGKIPTGVYDNP